MAETLQQFSLWSFRLRMEIHYVYTLSMTMSIEGKTCSSIQLMEARLLRTGNSELGRWITTTADSLGQAKKDLAEIERLLEDAKAKLRSED